MMDKIKAFRNQFPENNFTVAIADIDYFKHVNDTYGHNCGDYVLRELANLFVRMAADQYSVCRWGGEEFCFFFPDWNLDEAGTALSDINLAVDNLSLQFENHELNVTITAGAEENDFRSDIIELLEKADQKMYMGKQAGRNRVVL